MPFGDLDRKDYHFYSQNSNDMETRNVTLTLEKAKEFYNSGNIAVMEVAL